MGLIDDVGHALTGTKTDAQNRADRENEERRQRNRVERQARLFGGDGSIHYDYASGTFVNSDGGAVSDEAYDKAFGTGKAAEFREGAALVSATAPQQTTPQGNVAATTEQATQQFEQATQPRPRAPVDWAALASAGPTGNPALTSRTRTATAGGAQTGGLFDGFQRPDINGVFSANGGPGAPAPTINRDKIDPLLGGLDT